MSRRILGGIVVLILIAVGIIWFMVSKEKETATPVLSVSAENQTKKVSATAVSANPGDVIVFTLKAENQSDEVIEGYITEVSLSGITEKASLIDASGASYNSGTNSLVWTPLDIPANESIQKQFTIRVNPLGSAQAGAEMKVRFNNELSIQITGSQISGNTTPEPAPGYVAPTSGPSSAIAWVFSGVATLLYAVRKKLLVLAWSMTDKLGITSRS